MSSLRTDPTSTPTGPSLTERYIQAALRSVPPAKRSDIDAELRSSIADAVEDRVAAGADAAQAEEAVLTELGDPARLAANYTGAPLHLIGPALYLDYVRLLRVLLATVLPLTAAAVAVVQVALHVPAGRVVATVVGTTLTTGLHLVFWTTLGFALLERAPGVRTPLTGPWKPSMLPPRAGPRAPRIGELIALVVWSALFVTAILLTPRLSPRRDANGSVINILDPWLWDSGTVYVFIALIALSVGLTVASYSATRLAAFAPLAGIPAAALLLWLAANHHVLNPAFADALGWSSTATTWTDRGVMIAAGISIVTTILETAARFWRLWRR
ncbi:MAG TPA: permease prefix domain 1-containing protein [Micromonosporaceae bacterium]|jgi:hypothetical protein